MKEQFNGRTRLILEIAAIMVSLVVGFTASAFHFGTESQKVNSHISDTARHESPAVKRARIDSAISLNLRPILVELREINKRLDRMED